MSTSYTYIEGESVKEEELQQTRSLELVKAIHSLPFFRLTQCLRKPMTENKWEEILVFDVEPEISQFTTNDIRRSERIALTISEDSGLIPEIWALRSDFPKVPHTNLRAYEYPKSLCLYENLDEAKLTWTSARFLIDIRDWLSRTATGELHQTDQPLEPFLLVNKPRLILPHDCVPQDESGYVDVHFCGIGHGPMPDVVIGYPKDFKQPLEGVKVHRLFYLRLKPLTHGVIYRQPETFKELCELLRRVGIDGLSKVRDGLRDIISIPKATRPNYLIITLCIPKRRIHTSNVEDYEWWSFWLTSEIHELGCHLGIWQRQGTEIGSLIPADESKIGDDVGIVVMNTSFSFNRRLANVTSMGTPLEAKTLAMIGCGAVGSQVMLNMARMGIGKWHLIDHDIVLPHNLARHVAVAECVGYPKSYVLSAMANSILNETLAQHHEVRITGAKLPEGLTKQLTTCDMMIDATTSIAASRAIARDLGIPVRKSSCFINPSGTDAVLLCEDKARLVSLDSLEMQYYRMVLNRDQLSNHLDPPERGLRYSNSCREFTTIIAQSNIATLSGILTNAICRQLESDGAQISVWRSNPDTLGVDHFSVTPSRVLEIPANEWTIVLDESFVKKISMRREERLPNETGGVLVGCHDTKRKLIYIVDTIFSPSDSEERKEAYIRGVVGLSDRLQSMKTRTGGMVDYLGEWHSHPQGCSTKASKYDWKILTWLDEIMRPYGLPALMIIVGDDAQVELYLSEP